jgi:hypothetical protein
VELESNPDGDGLLEGSLKRVRKKEFSLPGGQYRAAYVKLVDDKVCLVFLVGPREHFYLKADRRFRALRKGLGS